MAHGSCLQIHNQDNQSVITYYAMTSDLPVGEGEDYLEDRRCLYGTAI